MIYGAIDLHTRYSQIRIIDAEGHVIRDQRVVTSRERLIAVFAGDGALRIRLESGTESEWVAAALEAAGSEVSVADPNFAPMYGECHRRVKTDGRDVAALPLPEALRATIAPLPRTLDVVTADIRALDRQLDAQASADPIGRRLQTVPAVGPIVALPFRSFVDDVHRFQRADQVSAAMGLVPRENSSGERRHRGHISKAGPPALRSLLIQAAWSCWHTRRGAHWRDWATQLASRRGKRIAVTARARRLSRSLLAMGVRSRRLRPQESPRKRHREMS